MTTDDDLIHSLSENLRPVSAPVRIEALWLAWLLLSAAFVVALIHAMGPVRAGSLEQLLSGGRFSLETALGLVAIIAGSLAAFRSMVPGALAPGLARLALGAVALWIGFYVFGLYTPALEPSMDGKRHHCIWETFVYATPPMLIAIALMRRYYPLQPLHSAAAAGVVAGLLPALYMQLACMYMPAHILAFHIMPGLLVGVLALAVARYWPRPRAT